MTNRLPQRKRPAHPLPVERHNELVILFVTIGLQPRVPVLANAWFRDAFVQACADADAWSVGRYVIMPDHVHLFCRPARVPRVGIKRWSGYLKRRITIRLSELADGSRDARPPWDGSNRSDGATGGRASTRAAVPFHWQSDCWDTQLRSAEHYQERWEYVCLNPVRAGLVNTPEDWPWQGEINVLRW